MNSPDLAHFQHLMQEKFGYSEFRGGQADVLSALSNSDVLGVMPTGSGKSFCYVLPAIAHGRTLVVSPLIALMRDQVDGLLRSGVRSALVNSSLSREANNANYQSFVRGEIDLLYVAPERLTNARFIAGLKQAGVNLLAIDEAHCVSEWGHDFRPEYLMLGAVRDSLGSPRTLALTATAQPTVQQDILQRLGIPNAARVLTSADRPNLYLGVEPINRPADRRDRLLELVRGYSGESGIVYARTRKSVEELAALLVDGGICAEPYHAGMPTQRRDEIQRRFSNDETPVIVATNAFGMGVDKPSVRFVIHFNMPGRLESYYQEAGRAGRDGEPADCILLPVRRDEKAQRHFIDIAHPDAASVRRIWKSMIPSAGSQNEGNTTLNSYESADEGFAMAVAALRASGLISADSLKPTTGDPNAPIDMSSVIEHKRHVSNRLGEMIEYCAGTGCRRAHILRYLGERPPNSCDNCDSCLGSLRGVQQPYPPELYEALVELREKLVNRTRREPLHLLDSRTLRELATHRPHNRDELLETFGIGEVKADWFGDDILKSILEWESINPGHPPRQPRPRRRSPSVSEGSQAGSVPDSDPLFLQLKGWRRQLAREEGVPAFTILSDQTLREIAAKRPRSRKALLAIKGVGKVKLQSLGRDVLELVRTAIAEGI